MQKSSCIFLSSCALAIYLLSSLAVSYIFQYEAVATLGPYGRGGKYWY